MCAYARSWRYIYLHDLAYAHILAVSDRYIY